MNKVMLLVGIAMFIVQLLAVGTFLVLQAGLTARVIMFIVGGIVLLLYNVIAGVFIIAGIRE